MWHGVEANLVARPRCGDSPAAPRRSIEPAVRRLSSWLPNAVFGCCTGWAPASHDQVSSGFQPISVSVLVIGTPWALSSSKILKVAIRPRNRDHVRIRDSEPDARLPERPRPYDGVSRADFLEAELQCGRD